MCLAVVRSIKFGSVGGHGPGIVLVGGGRGSRSLYGWAGGGGAGLGGGSGGEPVQERDPGDGWPYGDVEGWYVQGLGEGGIIDGGGSEMGGEDEG